jgi:hypothetical protein
MEEQQKEMNFVARKAATRRNLQEGSGALWQGLRRALQDCCDTYRLEFSEDVSCATENCHRLCFTKTFPAKSQREADSHATLLVEYDDATRAITYSQNSGKSACLSIRSDENSVFLFDKASPIEYDAACQKILEAFLFATVPPR